MIQHDDSCLHNHQQGLMSMYARALQAVCMNQQVTSCRCHQRNTVLTQNKK